MGKSSLLNAIQPGLGLAVNEISTAVNKGRHTTVTRQLFPLEGGGYVADTPGWKSLALWDTEPEEMDAYFPELARWWPHCQFSDCTHSHEPGCAVRAAVEAGRSTRSAMIRTCDCAPVKPEISRPRRVQSTLKQSPL